MKNLFGEEIPMPVKSGKPGKPKTNPLIPVYGEGPAGKKCKDCQFQFFRQYAKSYSKCEKREVSSSPKTDHNSRYQACGLFQPKPTGTIWEKFRCKACGHVSKASHIPQVHHDDRMRGFGWEKSDEVAENGDPVWIRPIMSCYYCPPTPKIKQKKR
ncbi:hypothetical protein [Spirosoma pollinicola]|uniref:Uncharacterized protein n=1 Tax=Spirosoma pollinicola TaxID=2057025 RepID=A0A2K8YTR2_9BACT|nr:hypothetical protein [Spirosoma pollinicola]AUD00969.1 hypothetical protein CWM47_03530 [Spirosoma pollinicola]